MNAIIEEELSVNLDNILDKVNEEHKPVFITRSEGKTAVLIDLEDFQAYKETLHLMASEKNEKRLNDAIQEIEESRN
ncbi:type II toxin-antitoxin system Phd/YefM family antitoxin [Marinomonas ushuaiensis]|nr:type II toxin-antitoxin system prevent-host-death family antitoxin [Marinomonas ushuaiensis]